MPQLIIDISAPAERDLRFHCLSGDELAVAFRAGLHWLKPAGFFGEPTRAGRRRLAFAYAGETSEHDLIVDIGRFRSEVVERIVQSARRLTPAAVDRMWRPTMTRIGQLPRPHRSADHLVVPLSGSKVAAARRIVHPSYILDRLMMRQRAVAFADMESLLFDPAGAGDCRQIA